MFRIENCREEMKDIFRKVISGDELDRREVMDIIDYADTSGFDNAGIRKELQWHDVVTYESRLDKYHSGYFNVEGQWYSVEFTTGLTYEEENVYPAQTAKKAEASEGYVKALSLDGNIITLDNIISWDEIRMRALWNKK